MPTVARGGSPNLVVIVVNYRDAARITVDLAGARAIDHRFAGSDNTSHPPIHTFEFQLPAGTIDIAVQAGHRSDSARVDLTASPVQWVVVQNYDTDELGIDVTTYTERPLFG